jgi:hypothetical protein
MGSIITFTYCSKWNHANDQALFTTYSNKHVCQTLALREFGIPTLRESVMIAIVLNVSIFTSKKTRSCSEFCLEGNTHSVLKVVPYDHDAV